MEPKPIQRQDGWWIARKQTSGKRINGLGRTPEEALSDLREKLNPPTIRVSDTPTLHEFAESVWWPRVKNLAPLTFKRYTDTYRKFIKHQLGSYDPRAVRYADVQEWADNLLRQGHSRETVIYARGVLSAIFNLAVRYEVADRNPASKIDLPGRAKPKRKRALSPDKAAVLITTVHATSLSCPVFLAVVLGLRRGEIAGLKWESIDRQTGRIRVHEQSRNGLKGQGVQTAAPKWGSAREIMAPKAILDMIDARGDLDSPYVCTHNGRPWIPNTLTRIWAEHAEALGLPDWTFHDLRHGAAGLLFAAGYSLEAIAMILGHADLASTKIYTDMEEEGQRNALGLAVERLGLR
jgi:integrase